MVLATGTGRCGTATFANIFGIPHEYRARPPGSLVGLHGRHAATDGHPWPEREDRVKLIRAHFDSFDLPHQEINESSWGYVGFLDAVYHLVPNARVVLLTRDVETYARSLVCRGAHLRSDWVSHPMPGAPPYNRWSEMGDVERAAWIWQLRYGMLLQQLARQPINLWMLCKIEEFYDRLPEISEFAGLKPDPDLSLNRRAYNTSERLGLPPPEEWEPSRRRNIREIAGHMMVRLGYGLEGMGR